MAQVVVVTGCSSGLGQALCTELIRKRDKKGDKCFRVFASARRLKSLEELNKEGVEAVEIDVTDQQSLGAATRQVLASAQKIDTLICNAGIAATAPLVEHSLQNVEQIFQTNALGVLRTIQAIAPSMMANRKGRIIVIGSFTACLSSPFNGAYAASKAALHSMCETLSMELDPFGVSVTEVWAGTMKTAINAKVAASLDKYSEATSSYHMIATEMKERSEYLEHSKSMSVAQVAKDIARALDKPRLPRYISTGAEVRMFTVLGYLQCWLCPGRINAAMQDKFGLSKLKQLLSASNQS